MGSNPRKPRAEAAQWHQPQQFPRPPWTRWTSWCKRVLWVRKKPGNPWEADHFEIVQNEEILEEPTHPEIGHLESRMLNLENALSRVIQHLEVLSTQPQNTTGGSIDPDWDLLEEAGDLSADCFVNNDSVDHINHERKYFQSLVCNITQELEQCLKEHSRLLTRPSLIDILEVFCSSDSQITHQCQQLGFRARRFDFSKGDLQTSSGRRELFHELIHHRPRHVWLAPSCGPWSSWSHLNGNRSLEAWDNLHATRMEHLSQVALGIVLLRYQRSQGRHMHWEQPRSSMMFKLPYLGEIHHYTVMADFEMCQAGDLRDPESGKPIKKSMSVLTTSPSLQALLSRYRCPGNHDHQMLEGSIQVQGQRINRTTYSEKYPRKFARLC